MAQAIRFHEAGGPAVLRLQDVAVGDPGPGQVRLRHVAVGLNFADTYFRSGFYKVPLPAGMGVEAAGVVEAIGPDVTNVAPGDRVTYTGFDQKYRLQDAVQAHRDLESRKTTGSSVFVI